jgi:hypothetical protein
MRPVRRLLLASLLLAGACGGGEPAAVDAAGPEAPIVRDCPGTELRLGSGARSFVAVEDGDYVWLYRGPQGGYMIYLSVQALGFSPDGVELCYRQVFTETGERFGEGCWKVRLVNDLGDGWHERPGIWGEVDDDYWFRPAAIRGRAATITATLTDLESGCQEAAGWSVIVHPDPGK